MTDIHNNAVLISNHKNTVQTDRFRVVAHGDLGLGEQGVGELRERRWEEARARNGGEGGREGGLWEWNIGKARIEIGWGGGWWIGGGWFGD